MLPPRVQLQQMDALTGSYPTNVRFSIDGRTGNYPIGFNDIYTIPFLSSKKYIPAVGFTENNIWLANSQSNDLTSSIVTTGSVRSQIIEGLPFFHFTPGQDLTPFRDNEQPSADGKSENNSFFATGSAISEVGEGFSSPLWSKDKIEIDLSVNSPQILNIDLLNDENSQQMSYFNFANKTWEALSDISLTDSNIRSGSLSNLQGKNITIGFAPSLGVPRVYVPAAMGDFVHGYYFMKTAGTQISNFGFPLNSRYYATSSQQYSISNNIQHPFLLEKVVLIISMSSVSTPIYTNAINDGFVAAPLANGPYTAAGYSEKTIIPFMTNNFFILHQRENAGNLRMFSDLADTTGTSIIPNNGITSERNLITNLRITSVNKPGNLDWNTGGVPLDGGYEPTIGGGAEVDLQTYLSEHNYVHIDPSGGSCEINPAQQLVVSGAVKLSKLLRNSYVIEGVSRSFPGISVMSQSPTDVNKVRTLSSGLTVSVGNPVSIGFKSNVEAGGRNGLGFNRISNRDFISPASVDTAENIRFAPNGTGTTDGQSVTLNNYVGYLSDTEQVNPYIIMPGDKLVFGWQLPAPFGNIHNQSGGYLDLAVKTTICPGMKVILYGSYIRAGREHNDGTNQLLSSDSVHEVIE